MTEFHLGADRGLVLSGGSPPNLFDAIYLDVYTRDEETVAALLAVFPEEHVCIDGPDPVADPVEEHTGFRLIDITGWSLLDQPSPLLFTDSGAFEEWFASVAPDRSIPSVDFEAAFVVVDHGTTRPCYPLVGRIVIEEESAARIELGSRGRGWCNDSAHAVTYVVSVDYAVLPEGSVTMTGPFGGDAGRVEVTPARRSTIHRPFGGPAGQEVDVTDEAGVVARPERGRAASALLSDGTPVWVVHHLDGSVDVLDAVTPGEGTGSVVSWIQLGRRFSGGGVMWDEYGRRLDGPRSGDLAARALRVEGQMVVVGQPLAETRLGDPVSGVLVGPLGARTSPLLPPLVSIEEALELRVGGVGHVEGTVVTTASGVARLCSEGQGGGEPGVRNPCATSAPVVAGILAFDPTLAGPAWCQALLGPWLLRRTEAGFEELGRRFGGSGSQSC